MVSREEVYNKLSNLLIDLFEVDQNNIHNDAKLYEDLDIDSIDAVDLVVELKSYTGKKISPEDFKTVRTVGDIVEAVYNLINN